MCFLGPPAARSLPRSPGGSAGFSTRSPAWLTPLPPAAAATGSAQPREPQLPFSDAARGNLTTSAAPSRRNARGAARLAVDAEGGSCADPAASPLQTPARRRFRPGEQTGKRGGQAWELSKVGTDTAPGAPQPPGVPAGAHPAAPPSPTPTEPASRGGRARRASPRLTRGRLPVSSSMAPLASFIAHCSGFTAPSPAAAAMAPGGEAVLAARGRGERPEARNEGCEGAGAARAADRRNTGTVSGALPAPPPRTAGPASRAEGAGLGAWLANNLGTAGPRAREFPRDPRSAAVTGPPAGPPPRPAPRADRHASLLTRPCPRAPRPSRLPGAERSRASTVRLSGRELRPEQDPRRRAAEPSGPERSRAEPSGAERAQRRGGRHETGPARPLPVAGGGGAAQGLGRQLRRRPDPGPPLPRPAERGRGAGGGRPAGLGAGAGLRGRGRRRRRRGRWVPPARDRGPGLSPAPLAAGGGRSLPGARAGALSQAPTPPAHGARGGRSALRAGGLGLAASAPGLQPEVLAEPQPPLVRSEPVGAARAAGRGRCLRPRAADRPRPAGGAGRPVLLRFQLLWNLRGGGGVHLF